MSKKNKKNQIEEPTENYEVTKSNEVNSEEMHPILVQLIEKSKKQHEQGLVFSHEEVMQLLKEKYPFL